MISHGSGGLSIWRPARINIVEPWGEEATTDKAHLRDLDGRQDASSHVEGDEVSRAIRRLRRETHVPPVGALTFAGRPLVLSSSRPPPPCEGSATSTLSHHGSRRKRPQRRQPVSFSSVPPYRPIILTPTGLFLQRRPRRVQLVRCQRFQPPRKLSRSLCHGASWSLAKWSRFTLVCSRGRQRRSSHKGARGEATGQGSRGGGDGARFGSAIAPKSRCCSERQFDTVGSERRAECTSGDGSR